MSDLSGNMNGGNVCLNGIRADGAKSLAKVLPQCTALARLNLSGDDIGAAGAKNLAGVLAQCSALTRLDLAVNQIGEAGAESLAGVLGQCTALVRLDLSFNGYNYMGGIGAVASGLLRASWLGPASGLDLDH
jgi:Ran GTPase-activating protein (RanGAP) involved in mRNA processing and transport